eukprot:107264_1
MSSDPFLFLIVSSWIVLGCFTCYTFICARAKHGICCQFDDWHYQTSLIWTFSQRILWRVSYICSFYVFLITFAMSVFYFDNLVSLSSNSILQIGAAIWMMLDESHCNHFYVNDIKHYYKLTNNIHTIGDDFKFY